MKVFALNTSLAIAGSLALFGIARADGANMPASPRGKVLYQQSCATCHGMGGAGTAIAPPLRGVIGRKVGATNFDYSAAMSKSPLIWSKTNLSAFLANPTKRLPGTRMMVAVPNEKDRKALVDYLATL